MTAIANHLWQSTLFAGAAALLTLLLKQNRAQVRYRIWMAASLKFLIPFSLLLSLGARIELPRVPEAPQQILPLVEQIGAPFTPSTPAPRATVVPRWLEPVAAVWILGSAFVLLRWLMRWRRARAGVRGAKLLPIEGPAPVMCSPARMEPGVFGVFRPVLLLPDGIAERLTPAQLQAILAHEFCHVRRRDNLAAAVHMIVEAVFWFHPLVWWIGARLIEERERACDEEVVRQGSDREAYATGILRVCRHYLESPLACASGVTGADLKRRMHSILRGQAAQNLTRSRKAILAAASMAALVGPLLIGSVQAQSEPAPRFEVATIKPVPGDGHRGFVQTSPGGGIRFGAITLKGLVGFAYNVSEAQISGGPSWAGSALYEVVAKPERPAAADNDETLVAPGTKPWDRTRLRMQALLSERFQLSVRTSSKVEKGYALVQARSGTKLVESNDTRPPGVTRNAGAILGRNGTMYMLATVLSHAVGRPVADRTGLTGGYSYKLEYARDPLPGEAPSEQSFGPSLFAALQEQLGLKLESAQVQIQTIAIERAERPSEN